MLLYEHEACTLYSLNLSKNNRINVSFSPKEKGTCKLCKAMQVTVLTIIFVYQMQMHKNNKKREAFKYFVCFGWGFMAQSTMRSCPTGQLKVVLFLGRLRPSKRLTSTKRGRPRQ